MTSKSQFSLFPESGDQLRSSLHGFEPVAGELTDFANRAQAPVGDLVLLAELFAAVNGCAVPNDRKTIYSCRQVFFAG